jgi:hypothetical protein
VHGDCTIFHNDALRRYNVDTVRAVTLCAVRMHQGRSLQFIHTTPTYR